MTLIENNKKPLIRLVYFSEAITPLDNMDVDMILKGAREKNHSHGVTGMLIFCNGFFLQCLEGPRGEVNNILESIVCDARHFNINMVETIEIEKREFTEWDMGYIGDRGMKNLGLKIDELEEFDQFYPPDLTAETLHNILVKVHKEYL